MSTGQANLAKRTASPEAMRMAVDTLFNQTLLTIRAAIVQLEKTRDEVIAKIESQRNLANLVEREIDRLNELIEERKRLPDEQRL